MASLVPLKNEIDHWFFSIISFLNSIYLSRTLCFVISFYIFTIINSYIKSINQHLFWVNSQTILLILDSRIRRRSLNWSWKEPNTSSSECCCLGPLWSLCPWIQKVVALSIDQGHLHWLRCLSTSSSKATWITTQWLLMAWTFPLPIWRRLLCTRRKLGRVPISTCKLQMLKPRKVRIKDYFNPSLHCARWFVYMVVAYQCVDTMQQLFVLSFPK